ncbi:waterproof [Carabus blaptoides fortunei]
MPVAIYRPCGTIGCGVGLATGAIKVVHLNKIARFHLVPVDMAANCMIAAAWNITVHRDKQVKIYNHFTEENALDGYRFMDAVINSQYPLECAFRYPGYKLTTSSCQYNIYALFIETIPNTLVDMVYRILGRNANRNAKCKRARLLAKVIKYFRETDFNFQTNNLPALWKQLDSKDRELFNFNSYSIDWNEYLQIFSCGIKEILLKEDMSQLGKVRHRHQLLHIYEYLFVILYGAAIWMVLYLMNIL